MSRVIILCLVVVVAASYVMAAQKKPPKKVEVVNFPQTQNVAGTVTVSNLPAVQQGTVAVSNLPLDTNGNLKVAPQVGPGQAVEQYITLRSDEAQCVDDNYGTRVFAIP